MTTTPRNPGGESAQGDFLHLLQPLQRHWLRFLLLWVLITVACIAGGAQIPPTFESKGTVYLDNPNDHAGGGSEPLAGMLSMLGGRSDLDSQKGILKTNEMALDLIRQLGINAKLRGPDQDLPERPFLWQYVYDRDPNRFVRGLHVWASDIR